tara:strand:- start:206 stop:568 length:363 start_codon:yes stop_codon:yes gene_type:complete
MITILNCIFPEDISIYIYNIIKKERKTDICLGKIMYMELMMINFINKHDYNKEYNILYYKPSIEIIYNLYKFIDNYKNFYIIQRELSNISSIIDNYYNVLRFHINYQETYVKKALQKFLP